MTDAARWKATVHVGGLAAGVTTGSLHDAFVPFGEIADVSLPKNENPNPKPNSSGDAGGGGGGDAGGVTGPQHRGFAYVEFEDAEDAREAIDNMDQSEFFGRVIRVSAAKPPKSADEGLGSKTAVWEQEAWLAEHAVSEEDRLATDQAQVAQDTRPEDPMQGLEGLDVAGPKPE